MMQSVLLWVGAGFFGMTAISMIGATEKEAAEKGKSPHIGYFVGSVFLMGLALLMANAA